MKLPSRKSLLWPAVIFALAAVLVTLGVLQYRWSREVSEAATARMRADLVRSMVDFRRDFYRELASVARALEPSYSERSDFESYAREWAKWRRTTSHPGMVKDVYIWQHGPAHSQLLKIKRPGEEPERVNWPPELEPLRSTVIASMPVSRVLLRAPGPRPPRVEHRRPQSGKAGVTIGISPQIIATAKDGRVDIFEGSVNAHGVDPAPPGDASAGLQIQYGVSGGAPGPSQTFVHVRQDVVPLGRLPWMLIPSVPALVHPLVLSTTGANQPSHGCRTGCTGWMIIPLDQAFLGQHLFAELAARHFPGHDYEVTVVSGEKGDRVVYSSDPRAAPRLIADADASMSLFSVPGALPPAELDIARLPRLKGVSGEIKYGDFARVFGGDEAIEVRPMPGVSPLDGWQLVVNSRLGSLEAAVAALRRRNLAISFGVMLVLAATMGIIILATRRIQALAKLQMDFVAGVSHELRTPLTVISSAADNIADGVVERKEHVVQYGLALKTQAVQLTDLVEQILSFAATRDNRQTYTLRVAQVGEALDLALHNTAELIRRGGFAVECHVSSNLPNVLIDVQALSCCLQNLITNAIKYSGDASWIGIWVKAEEEGREIIISVRDHGIGIAAEDMKHIFEPFYRSPTVRDAQIRGSGLGLSVATSIVEAMNGRITVESETGRGSLFTVHLPTVQAIADQRERREIAPVTLNIS